MRTEHPGYYGVVIGAALPWYMGLGLVFTFLSGEIRHSRDYDLAFAYVPVEAWGALYLLLGVTLAIAATVPKVPHIYVRALMGVGWLCTFFFEVTFCLTLITNGLDTPTILAAWGTILVVEFKAIVEPERNPLSHHR